MPYQFGRNVREASSNSPALIRLKSGSPPGRLRYGLFCGPVGVPRYFPDLLRTQVADISLSLLNEFCCIFVHPFKVVRRIILPVVPIVSEPFNIFFDRLDIFDLFLGRVGIIESQIAKAPEFLCDSKIEADGFGMSYMQVTIRFRRKPGMDLSAVRLPLCPLRRHFG
jgi:hypothetical protein